VKHRVGLFLGARLGLDDAQVAGWSWPPAMARRIRERTMTCRSIVLPSFVAGLAISIGGASAAQALVYELTPSFST